MPQNPQTPPSLQDLLLQRQPATNQSVQLPTNGPDNWLDKALRVITTATGLEQQKPGDLPSAIGAAAGAAFPMRGMRSGLGVVEDSAQLPEQLTSLTGHVPNPPAGVGESAIKGLFDKVIDKGTMTNSPVERRNAVANARTLYQQLADKGAAAQPDELSNLRNQAQAIRGTIGVAPTGGNIPMYQANIINKLVQSGYTPSEGDVGTLSSLISKMGLQQYVNRGGKGTFSSEPLRTGEVVRLILGQMKGNNNARTANLRNALNNITGWASVE